MNKLKEFLEHYKNISPDYDTVSQTTDKEKVNSLLLDFAKDLTNSYHKAIEQLEQTDAYDNGITMSDLFENEFINDLC